MSLFKGSADLPPADSDSPLAEDEQAVLDKLARKAVDRSMTVPSILFLESVKPLNYIGSQALVFFEPIVQSVFNFRDYTTLRTALEKRETIEILIQKIEAHDAVAQVRNKKIKQFLKQEKKNWKWYQRWLGVFTPKVKYPPDILNPPPESDSSARRH